MRLRSALALLLLLNASCWDDVRLVPETRVYVYDLVSPIEECVASTIPCSQSAAFCADGSLGIAWSDIVHSGRYRIDGRVDYSNRFAYDIVSAEEFERLWPRPRNEDFPTWGKPILAPAAGVVAATRDGVADNAPGKTNTGGGLSMGNFVSINHGGQAVLMRAEQRHERRSESFKTPVRSPAILAG